MNSNIIKSLRCPECKNEISFYDEKGDQIVNTLNTENIKVFICNGCKRWFPTINKIPRLLPDLLRDIISDKKFFNENQMIFSKTGLDRSCFGKKRLDENIISVFQRQRFKWGEQENWDNIYQVPVPYDQPEATDLQNIKKRNNFFNMNLHCYYGLQPKREDIFHEFLGGGKQNVLDVGCGNSSNKRIAEELGNYYIGIDIMAKLNPDIQGSAMSLPFDDFSFDYVICDSVLEHLYDPFKASTEIFRVLKNGGNGYIAVPFSYKNHGSPFDFFRYTKSGLHTLMRDYQSVCIYPFGGFVHALGHMIESVYSHCPFGIGKFLKAIHNVFFFFLNKLDKFDKHKIFSRGFYAVVRK